MTTMADRWIKQPGPGQYRGEGKWVPFTGSDDHWDYARNVSGLPTHEGAKPEECE